MIEQRYQHSSKTQQVVLSVCQKNFYTTRALTLVKICYTSTYPKRRLIRMLFMQLFQGFFLSKPIYDIVTKKGGEKE